MGNEVDKAILAYRESELAVIGTMLVSRRACEQIGSVLRSMDFYYSEHRELFELMKSLSDRGSEVNILSVFNELTRKGKGSKFPLETIEVYLNYQVGPQDAITFARQISEAAGIRELGYFYETEATKFKNGNFDALDTSLMRLSATYKGLVTRGVSETSLTGSALKQALFDLLAQELVSYPLLGIEEIDKDITDFSGHELIVVAARPGMGKTTVALQSAIQQKPSAENRVGIISCEMMSAKLLIRGLAQLTSIDSRDIRKLNEEEFDSNDELMSALDDITDGIILDSEAPYTISNIKSKIYNMVYNLNAKIIYIDYLGLILSDDSIRASNRQEEIAQICRTLKSLAMELDIPIVVLSQLNRGVEHRPSNRPMLADLRESGAVEQDASIVVFVYPNQAKMAEAKEMTNAEVEEYLRNNTDIPTIVEIAKQRNGPLFTTEVMFEKRYNRFTSMRDRNRTYGEPVY